MDSLEAGDEGVGAAWNPLEAGDVGEGVGVGWNPLEAGGKGVGWDPQVTRPLAGKPSRVLAGPPTEFCRELVAWEPMQALDSAGSPTEDQTLDLA